MSYNTALSDNKDKVRLLTGDTDTADELLVDAEINLITGQSGSIWSMAADACLAIASKFSRHADQTVGSLSYDFSQRAEQYKMRALDLRRRAVALVTPWAGGISIADKQTQEDDSDRVRPAFARGQHEDTEAVQDSRYSDWSGTKAS